MAWVESSPLGCEVRPVVWWPCCGWRLVHEEELGWCPLEWVRAVVASQGGPPGQLCGGGVLRVGGVVLRVGGDSGVGSSGLSGFFRRVLGERRGGAQERVSGGMWLGSRCMEGCPAPCGVVFTP